MEEMLLCSLCEKRARMVCESDEAKLCWECDHKVHSANFLVERHLRILLCRLCQSPTPWKASGPSLTPTFSLCHPCYLLQNNNNNNNNNNNRDEDDGDSDQDESNVESYESGGNSDVLAEEEEEEDGENQVVPWFSPFPFSSAGSDADADRSSSAAAASSSSAGGGTSRSPLTRLPLNSSVHHDFDDETGGSSSTEELCSRPLKKPRIGINQREAEAEHWHNHKLMVKKTEDYLHI